MPIFEGFTDDEVQRIKNAGTFVTLPADWSPIWEKTPSDKAYILLSGEVSVRKDGQEIARLGPGEIIGEVGIVNHKLRTRLHRDAGQGRGAALHQRRPPAAVRGRSRRSRRRWTRPAQERLGS